MPSCSVHTICLDRALLLHPLRGAVKRPRFHIGSGFRTADVPFPPDLVPVHRPNPREWTENEASRRAHEIRETSVYRSQVAYATVELFPVARQATGIGSVIGFRSGTRYGCSRAAIKAAATGLPIQAVNPHKGAATGFRNRPGCQRNTIDTSRVLPIEAAQSVRVHPASGGAPYRPQWSATEGSAGMRFGRPTRLTHHNTQRSRIPRM